MPRPSRLDLRQCVPMAMRAHGYAVQPKLVKGVVPGARLVARKNNTAYEVAVRSSLNRGVAFNRAPSGKWIPISNVQMVLVAAVAASAPNQAEIFCFDSDTLAQIFDRLYTELVRQGRALQNKSPIFLSLDQPLADGTRLIDHARWRECLPLETGKVSSVSKRIEELKEDLANATGIDIGKINIKIEIAS